MNNINKTIAGLELVQIGWVVSDIHVAVKFLVNTLGIAGFPQAEYIRAQDLDMTYYGKVVVGEWYTLSDTTHTRENLQEMDTSISCHIDC